MSRKTDLEISIRESYEIIREYEAIIRTSDRPEEKARARRMMREQHTLVEEYLAEFISLAGDDVPEDIAQIAHHLASLKQEFADLWERLPKPPDIPCPYRGLEPFEVEHAESYFGRGAMIERLLTKVKERDFVAVIGPSGCGKSSLVRAGLVTALREGALLGSEQWAIRIFRPGADPVLALAMPLVELLEPEATGIDYFAETRKLADHLRDETLSMADITIHLREKRRNLPRLVLIADQFEELYTECRDEVLQNACITSLLAMAEHGIKIILTLRADFFGRVLDDKRLGKAVDAGQVNVLPMTQEELRAAIEQPALRTGRAFEPGVVERILDDVTGEPGNLPLLEFALTGLWEEQTATGVLTHEGYVAIGKVEGAIAQRAEAVYRELEKQGRGEIVQRIFSRLTHYGENVEGTRRRVTLDDLVTPHTPRQEIEAVILGLADARLLVTGRRAEAAEGTAPQRATAEVAHEALIRGWKRLRRWLDEDRAFGLWREKLAIAQRMWEETECDQGGLLRGTSLAEAEGWLRKRQEDLNNLERAFIEESLALRERERQAYERKRSVVIGVAILVTLVMSVLGMFSFNRSQEAQHQAATATYALGESEQQRTAVANALGRVEEQVTVAARENATAQAALEAEATAKAAAQVHAGEAKQQQQIALARQLVTQAELMRTSAGGSWKVAGLLAIESLSRYPGNTEALAVLYRVLERLGCPASWLQHNADVKAVALSPDSQWVATWSANTARVWEVATGMELAHLEHDNEIESVTFSPDGQWMATQSADTARMWEAGTWEELDRPEHDGRVESVAFSPDGQWVAAIEGFGTVRVWEVRTGEELTRLEYHDGVQSVTFSPDGKKVAAGFGLDTYVSIWEPHTDKELAKLQHGATVQSVAFSPDGRWIATESFYTARVWEAGTWKELARLEHDAWLSSVVFSPDGQWMATSSSDGTVRVWEAGTWKELVRLQHGATVQSVAFSPDGRWMAMVGENTVRGWEAGTWKELARLEHDGPIATVVISPDGKRVVTAGKDSTTVWDVSAMLKTCRGTGVELTRLEPDGYISTVVFSSDKKRVATVSEGGTVRVWDIPATLNTGAAVGKELARLEYEKAVIFSPDGQWVATWSANTVRVWEAATGKELAQLEHDDHVWDVAFRLKGQRVATASKDGTVRVWEATTGKEVARLEHGTPVDSVAFSPDGQWVVTAELGASTARVWEASTWKEVAHSEFAADAVSVAFSPDGQWVVTTELAESTARVWEASTWKELARLEHPYTVGFVAFSTDGRWVATASQYDAVRMWDVSTWKELGRLEYGASVVSVTFSPDGRWVATDSDYDVARVWDLSTWKELAQLQHDDSVRDVAFSSDGQWVATAGSRVGTARVWEAGTWKELVRLQPDDGVRSVTFDPDGRWWATVGSNAVQVWVAPGHLVARVCAHLTRNLTQEEWANYLGDEPYHETCPMPEPKELILAPTPTVTPVPSSLLPSMAVSWLNMESR